jgi:5,10-methylenetetrahydrofolate reductase
MCAEIIKELKGMAQGVHIMAIGWEKKVPDIIAAAGL